MGDDIPGCHGVQGFCGSGIQVAMLRDAAWRAQAHAAGVAVVYLHALNPYGFSWWRRTTHEKTAAPARRPSAA